MRYISTRGLAPPVDFFEALLTGLAPDGGLYVPARWPQFSPETIAAFAGQPFHDVVAAVMLPFTGGTLGLAQLTGMTRQAYAHFDHPAVAPLVQIGRNRFILELFHGPTLAFKDLAMQLVVRLMDHTLAARNSCATIVGATSGDTGGAAVEAFRSAERADLFILFPKDRVSDVQRRMMTTPKDRNIHAIAIEGTFDDCQRLVKDLFNDRRFRNRVCLAGINSINWARIAAQAAYYFAAAAALGGPRRAVAFAVPTGNFGDVYAGHAARRSGLPVARLLAASNANDILPRTYATGRYETRAVVATSSPSMDIQVSSNFERYLFEAIDGDAAGVRARMEALSKTGQFDLGAAWPALRRDFAAAAATEEEVACTIRSVKAACGYLLDPHTACAVVAADKVPVSADTPEAILATAHPAKFPAAMEAIAGVRLGLPARLANVTTDAERVTVLANDSVQLMRLIGRRARATQESLA
ncbi:MAG: threonine synthase [Hyphomicrobiaceae bacterium]